MPTFFANHHTLHYVTKGDSKQPSLLLLHGFLGSHQDFTEIVGILSQHFYCIVPDLPGHGRTRSRPDSYTFQKTAKSLVALLRHLRVAKTHLLGYSMGGRLALYLVCEFPDYFLRVVLESASPGLRTAEERQARRERDGAIAHKIETLPLPSFLTQWYSNPLFASLQQYPERYSTMLQRRKNNVPAELAQVLCGMGTGQQPSLWEALAQIEQDLLLIVGDLDTKFVAINREMIAATDDRQQSKLAVLENYGHNLHLEAPVLYTHTVLRFYAHL